MAYAGYTIWLGGLERHFGCQCTDTFGRRRYIHMCEEKISHQEVYLCPLVPQISRYSYSLFVAYALLREWFTLAGKEPFFPNSVVPLC